MPETDDKISELQTRLDRLVQYQEYFYREINLLREEIKTLEEKYDVQLFERQSLAFIIKDKIEVIPLQQLEYDCLPTIICQVQKQYQ